MKIDEHQAQVVRAAAFSRLELVVVILILAVLLALLLRALPDARVRAQRVNCVSHLVQIGLAMKVWANDHRDKFPMAVSTNHGGTLEFVGASQVFRHFQAVSNEVQATEVLVCHFDMRRRGQDWRTLGNSNVSYFIGLDADKTAPRSILAGDRTLDGMPRRSARLLTHTTNSALQWAPDSHAGAGGNVVLADGSAYQLPGPELTRLFSMGANGDFTNRLEFP